MVHGVESVADYLRLLADFTLDGRAAQIRCPTLVGSAEGDPTSLTSQRLFDALECPKARVHHTLAEGASGHCERSARTLVSQRSFDWLGAVLSLEPAAALTA